MGGLMPGAVAGWLGVRQPPAGGPGGCCTLNETYKAGASQTDQTIEVSLADGGQVVFTGIDTALYTDWQNPFAAGTTVTSRRHYTMGVNALEHFADTWIENIAAPVFRQINTYGRRFSRSKYNTNTPNFYSVGVGVNLRVESFQTVLADAANWMWVIVEDDDVATTGGKQKFYVETRMAGNASTCWGFGTGGTILSANTIILQGTGGARGVVFKVDDGGANIKHIRYDDILRGAALAGTVLTVPIVKFVFIDNVTVEHNAAAPPAGTLPIKLAGSVNLVAKADDVLTLVMDGNFWQEDGRKIS